MSLAKECKRIEEGADPASGSTLPLKPVAYDEDQRIAAVGGLDADRVIKFVVTEGDGALVLASDDVKYKQ